MTAGDPSTGALWRIVLALLARLPQGAISRMTGRLARVPLPRWARRPVLGTFVRRAGIDMSEAERALEEYTSLDELFVRRLRPGARTWPDAPGLIASPVDGIIGEFGRIHEGRAIQAKGIAYAIERLLDLPDARDFENGDFLTIYLSPRHYHRIHAPISGHIRHTRWIPGALLPVNPAAIHSVVDLFPRNERVVCRIESAGAPDAVGAAHATAAGADAAGDARDGAGSMALVAVGAFNVGCITASYDPGMRANRPRAEPVTRVYDPPIAVHRGDEILAFHLGSTVILLFEPERIRWADAVATGGEIRVGQVIASTT